MQEEEAFIIEEELNAPNPMEQDEERIPWPEDYIAQRLLDFENENPETNELLIQEDTSPEQVLEHYWGHKTFRPLQKEIILSALKGEDVLALLPTGGGKSICFQVPALMSSGLSLVITPLISLMKDQVENLQRRGIKAAAIHGGMSADRINQTIRNCIFGKFKLLYISPERLNAPSFREQLEHLSLSRLIIDECHCICQWGYDFRPSYLNIKELRKELPDIPILALTATATPDVVEGIKSELAFDEQAKIFQKSFFRPNLSYSIRRTSNKEDMLLHILSRVSGSAIIYCRSRALCGKLARFLREHKISASSFHAGLSHTERDLRQSRWMNDELRVMVATNAFGMGIDKPDVRLVIHLALPSSLEEYFQEAGRAGRDEKRSYAVLLVGKTDATSLKRRFSDSFPKKALIRQTFEDLCSFLQVGIGEGFQKSYEFDIDKFTYYFRLNPIQTKYALEIMEAAKWLSYKKDETRSRLKFICRREELYQSYVGHDEILQAILRSYTGLFSDYVFIQEEVLASLSGFSLEEVYMMLSELNRLGVLHYIPSSNTPRILFHIRREPAEYLSLPASVYEERRERMRERIQAGIHYILDNKTCRSQLLLAYFGEHSEKTCGICDVCLQRTDLGLNDYILNDVEEYVLAQLQTDEEKDNKLLPIQEVCQALAYNPSDIITALECLAHETEYFTIQGDLLVLTES